MGSAFIAELAIPAHRFRIEKTAGPGHYTARGDAGAMLDCVRHVERVWIIEEVCGMVYALWDTRTTNLIAACDNESEALALLLSGIERNGPHHTDTLVLEVEDDDGELVSTMQGQELANLARKKRQPLPVTG